MIKKTITYSDLDGNLITEDFYFNIKKDELFDYETSVEGGMSATLNSMVEKGDAKEILKAIKDLILRSYGKRSPDGKGFIKSQELTDSFYFSEAYSELFSELATDAEAAAAFVNGIFPQALVREALLAQNSGLTIIQ